MANTVYGPYSGITCINGSTPLNATFGNLIQTQSSIALHGFNSSLIGAGFVLSGCGASKDGTVANQLDIASGVAYVVMSDGTVGEIAVVADNTHTTATINTTYYLYLQPDGSWYWSTTNAPAANSLAIAQVTTDASGNIRTVTDMRTLSTGILGTGVLAPQVASMKLSATSSPNLASNAVIGGVTFGGAAAIAGDSSAASASFNGSTGYVQLPPTSLPTGNGAFTLEGWFKTASNTGAHFIAGYGGSTAKTAALLYINNGAVVVDLFSNTVTSALATYADNNWHYAAGTWDGTTLRLYVDGAATGTPITPGVNAIPANPLAFIGVQYTTSFLNWWNGSLAEIAIYSIALASTRITAHFTAATAGGYVGAVQSDSPVRYYRLNEPVGALYANCAIPSTLQTVGADGSANLGRVATIGGQASVGALGAGVIVAQALDVSVTTAGTVNVLNYTPPTTGLYRISGHIRVGASGNITASVPYNDAHGSTPTAFFATATSPVASLLSQAITAPTTLPLMPLVIWASPAAAIQCRYANSAASPSDFVTYIIERLA